MMQMGEYTLRATLGIGVTPAEARSADARELARILQSQGGTFTQCGEATFLRRRPKAKRTVAWREHALAELARIVKAAHAAEQARSAAPDDPLRMTHAHRRARLVRVPRLWGDAWIPARIVPVGTPIKGVRW